MGFGRRMNLEQARSLGLAAAQLLPGRASEPIEPVSLLRRMAAMGQNRKQLTGSMSFRSARRKRTSFR
jgi:hypothetical protein